MSVEMKGTSPARPRPNPRPASPEKPKTYATLTAEKRLGVVALIGPTFREVLTEMAAERAAAEANEVAAGFRYQVAESNLALLAT